MASINLLRTSAPPLRVSAPASVRVWLIFVAALVFAMVLVGGATRLTESGLSITQWKPVTGVLSPLNAADWQSEFERYKQIPQYAELNPDMTLEGFKTIFWWEWSHRLLARIVGAAFILPALWFWMRGALKGALGRQVAVATGLASFSLGTDTAGSGRIPAAFNNLIGLKPTRGRLSTRGVVPANRSLDCVSIFALDSEDAATVLDVTEGYDGADIYSRKLGNPAITALRFGVPRRDQLEFFGDTEYARLFDIATARIEALGGTRVEIDFAPFLAVARLFHGGPWVAERYAAVGDFMDSHPDAVHPVTRAFIAGGKTTLARDAFEAQYRLLALKRASESAWAQADLLVAPTAGTIYAIEAIEADPVRLNATLGHYAIFMNFFDLAGVAVPAGFRADGLPFGICLIGPQSTERALLKIAGRLHRVPLGVGKLELADGSSVPETICDMKAASL